MRVYDRNLEEFPVTVDLYGKYARITDYSFTPMDEERKASCCDIVSRMLYVQKDHVVFYHRDKREGREQHEILSEESVVTKVKENGLSFTVDLTKRIDTGLFLDHAVTRQMVREKCMGMKVLNLFSYTGAFSVYAASGGATRVVSVDLSSTYTEWARKNLLDNGFSGDEYPCVAADATKYVEELLEKGEKFDLIIFDPPSFSNSHKMDSDFDVQRDHIRWLWVLNGLLTDDGLLLFSNNLGSFQLDKRLIRGYSIQELSPEVAAPGFSQKKGTARTWLLAKTEDVGPKYYPQKKEPAQEMQEEEKMATKKKADEEVKKDELTETTTVETAQHEGEEAPKAKKTTKKSTATKAKKATTAKKATSKKKADEETKPVEEAKAEEPAKAEESKTEETKVEEDVLTLNWSEEKPVVNEEAKVEEPVQDEEEAKDQDQDEEEESEDEGEEENEEGEGDGDEDKMSKIAKAFQPRPYAGRPAREDGDGDSDDRPSRDGGDRGGYGRDRDDRRGGYGRDRDDRRGGYGRDRDDRRGGYGRDRDDRRGGYGRDRDDRRSSYGSDRGGYGRDRDDRRSSFGGDRGGYGRDRDDRRSSYGSDRGGYGRDRDDRRSSYGSDRGGYGRDRDDRRSSYGSDRGGYGRDRDDRRSSFGGDRGGYGRDRDDRRSSYGSDRGGYGRDRDDRRSSYGSDRGGYGRDRDDRRSSFGGDRGGFGGRDRGFSRPDRYRDDDRKSSFSDTKRKPKPYGYDKFRDTPDRGENEDNDSFFWLDNDKKKGGDDNK